MGLFLRSTKDCFDFSNTNSNNRLQLCLNPSTLLHKLESADSECSSGTGEFFNVEETKRRQNTIAVNDSRISETNDNVSQGGVML